MILIGIGLNVDNEKPSTCLNAALKEANAISPVLKKEDILAYFFNKFENLFEIFSNQGNLDFVFYPHFAAGDTMLTRTMFLDV